MSAGTKLLVGLLAIAAAIATAAYLGARANWEYYLSTDECLERCAALSGAKMRVSGRIAADTLRLPAGLGETTFALEGRDANLPVVCARAVPDDLAERREVVVEGRLDEDGVLHAQKIMTRCASKYRSEKAPEVRQANARPAQEVSR